MKFTFANNYNGKVNKIFGNYLATVVKKKKKHTLILMLMRQIHEGSEPKITL